MLQDTVTIARGIARGSIKFETTKPQAGVDRTGWYTEVFEDDVSHDEVSSLETRTRAMGGKSWVETRGEAGSSVSAGFGCV